MKPSKILILFLLLFSLSARAVEFEAKEGVLDLAGWDYSKNPVIDITGNFEFYWNLLIDPSTDDFPEKPAYSKGFTKWNSEKVDGKEIGSFGYATYRLFIINVPEIRLNLQLTSVTTACKVWINGSVITEVGTVGDSKESSKPHYENRIVPLEEGHSSMEMVIQISNFHHRKGGFGHPFRLGVEESTYIAQREKIFLDGVLASCYLFAGIFFITLWIFRKKEKSLLYMSLFCLTIFPRSLVSGDYMINTVMPDLNWYLLVHIEYLTLFLPYGFILLFIRERFPDQSPKKIVYALAGIMFVQAIATTVLPTTILTWLAVPHQYIALIGFVLILFIIIKAMKDYATGSYFGGWAILCLMGYSICVMLRYFDVIEPVPYTMAGLQVGFLLSMSLIIGARFSANFTKVEALQIETAEQKDELETQKLIVEQKNEEIVSSISYAKRIQAAILPSLNRLTDLKPDSFIFYRPKDIVAGDFYWIEQKGSKLFFSVADCTGHGVPGAMVSVVCNSAMNRSVREFGLEDPGAILDKTRELVLETFETSDKEVKDGMDLALCVLDLETNVLKYAGANNSLYLIPANSESWGDTGEYKILEGERNNLIEYKGDKQPIGVYAGSKPFVSHEVQLSSGDCIYMSSDGYPDQFGGEKGKKFMYKPFKRLLLDNHQRSFDEQLEAVANRFDEWMEGFEQTDDVCVMGLKI